MTRTEDGKDHPLELAAQRLEGAPAPASADEASMLLAALGYAGADQQPQLLANRLALLRLGARMGDVFRLPSELAPGLVAMGARSPEAGGPGFAGRGLTLAEAFESCMGEAAEYLSFLRQPGDPRVSPADDTVGAWLMTDGAACRLPAADLFRDPNTGKGARSGGTGAGPDRDSAARAAVLEAIERDAVARWWRDDQPAREIPEAEAVALGATARLATLRAGVARRSWLIELTPDHGLPVVAALSSSADGTGVVAGFAARPRLAQAALAALLELCQMEVAQHLAVRRCTTAGEAALSPGEQIWLARHRHLSTDAFPKFRGGPGKPRAREMTPIASASEIAHRLAETGACARAAEITQAEIGVPVVRVLIEGFQDMGDVATLDSTDLARIAPI
ncbi:MAG: YcaO-like family protein [Pikeienuella sp.]